MDFPLYDASLTVAGGSEEGASNYASLPFTSVANAKGAYGELISSLPFDAAGVQVSMLMATAGVSHLVDLAVGAAGSETVVIPDLIVECGLVRHATTAYFPVNIPRGVRVAARNATNVISSAIRFGAVFHSGGFNQAPPIDQISALGTNISDSGGKEIDPGGSAHTKAAWIQMGTTDRVARWVTLGCAIANANAAPAGGSWLVDIGIGSPTVSVIAPNLAFNIGANNANETLTPNYYGFPLTIPMSTQVWVRAQSSITDATDRLIDTVFYFG